MGVTLRDTAIGTQRSVVHGKVTFVVQNKGTHAHELVVLRGRARPSVKNGRAAEAGRGLGEVEGVQVGASKRLTLTLKPGTYLLICNLRNHYAKGMSTTLAVH